MQHTVSNTGSKRGTKRELLKNGLRDHLLFVLGTNTGLRISDILALRVRDVRDTTHIRTKETKTGKAKRVFITEYLREHIDQYIARMDDDEHLFQSREGTNRPLSRSQAYRILNRAAKAVGIDEVGTHTLRKTFGYWHYQQFKDVAILQELFNHSAPSVILRYIGINQDVMDATMKGFSL